MLSQRGANRLLAALPTEAAQLLAEVSEPVAFSLGQVLWQPGEPIPRIYFPTAGILSAVVVMEDGSTIEGWLTGNEGVAGAEAAFGIPSGSWRMLVQADGAAIAVAPTDLEAILRETPAFQGLLFRYIHTAHQQATQSLACNRFHPIAERLARWLLMTMDRQDGSPIQMTHDFLAQMLGTQRPSVTVALATLEHGGLILRAGRGTIDIVDRPGLEEASCECYGRTLAEAEQVVD